MRERRKQGDDDVLERKVGPYRFQDERRWDGGDFAKLACQQQTYPTVTIEWPQVTPHLNSLWRRACLLLHCPCTSCGAAIHTLSTRTWHTEIVQCIRKGQVDGMNQYL